MSKKDKAKAGDGADKARRKRDRTGKGRRAGAPDEGRAGFAPSKRALTEALAAGGAMLSALARSEAAREVVARTLIQAAEVLRGGRPAAPAAQHAAHAEAPNAEASNGPADDLREAPAAGTPPAHDAMASAVVSALGGVARTLLTEAFTAHRGPENRPDATAGAAPDHAWPELGHAEDEGEAGAAEDGRRGRRKKAKKRKKP